MQNIIKITFLLFTLFPNFIFGQTNFYKIYTNNGYDIGQGVVQLEDSSYVITGSSSSFKEGASQAFLLKVDSLGKYIWSKDFGGDESEGGRRVLYKKNVGYFIAGYTNSIGKGGYDNYLAKTNEKGDLLWEKSYGGIGWEKVNDAVLLSDTTIIMVGQTNSGTAGNNNFNIIRANQNGDTLWTKNYGTKGEDFATCVKMLNDSICIIGGQMYIEDSLKTKAYLICLNKNGKIKWEHYFGNDGEYRINDLCIVGNDINVVGFRKNKIKDDFDGYAAKVNLNGVFLNEQANTSLGNESYEQISKYGSLDKLYVAFNQELSGSTFPIGKDLYLGRFRTELVYDNVALSISNTGDDIAGQIIPTNDGGAIIVGYNSAFGTGGNNIFITKVGRNDVFPNTIGAQVLNSLVHIQTIQEDKTEISIYPNPISAEFNIELPMNFEGNIEIRDITGKLVYEEIIKENNLGNLETKYTLSLPNHIENGNYLISILSNDFTIQRPFPQTIYFERVTFVR